MASAVVMWPCCSSATWLPQGASVSAGLADGAAMGGRSHRSLLTAGMGFTSAAGEA